jgi:hypothetical protein
VVLVVAEAILKMMAARIVVVVVMVAVVVSIKRVLQAGPLLPPALRFSGCFHCPFRSAHLLEDTATGRFESVQIHHMEKSAKGKKNFCIF